MRGDFPDPLGPAREIIIRYLVDIILFIALEKVEYKMTVLDKIATQTVVSSLVDNIIRTIANTSIKNLTKNWHKKLKEIYYMYVQINSMIFVHYIIFNTFKIQNNQTHSVN